MVEHTMGRWRTNLCREVVLIQKDGSNTISPLDGSNTEEFENKLTNPTALITKTYQKGRLHESSTWTRPCLASHRTSVPIPYKMQQIRFIECTTFHCQWSARGQPSADEGGKPILGHEGLVLVRKRSNSDNYPSFALLLLQLLAPDV